MKIYDNSLNQNNVSIKFSDGEKVKGIKCYRNSGCQLRQGGRLDLEDECSPEIVQEVYAVWGDTPTVTDPEPLPPTAQQPSSQDKLNASLMIEIAKLKAGV